MTFGARDFGGAVVPPLRLRRTQKMLNNDASTIYQVG